MFQEITQWKSLRMSKILKIIGNLENLGAGKTSDTQNLEGHEK